MLKENKASIPAFTINKGTLPQNTLTSRVKESHRSGETLGFIASIFFGYLETLSLVEVAHSLDEMPKWSSANLIKFILVMARGVELAQLLQERLVIRIGRGCLCFQNSPNNLLVLLCQSLKVAIAGFVPWEGMGFQPTTV